MALTGPWPCRTSIPTTPAQKQFKHLLRFTSQELGCPRVRRSAKRQTPVATHVAAPERPPGYVQRSRRRSNKHTVAREDEEIQQAPEQLQQGSRGQQGPAADGVAAVDTALHSTQQQEQQQLQDWQQQQQLLQQQWQQQALQEEARQHRQQLQQARQQPRTQQQQQQQQPADTVHDQQGSWLEQQLDHSRPAQAVQQQQHPQQEPVQQQTLPLQQQQQEQYHQQQSPRRQRPQEPTQQQQQQQRAQQQEQRQRHTQQRQQQPQQQQEPDPRQIARQHELYNSPGGISHTHQRSRPPSRSNERSMLQAEERTQPGVRQMQQQQQHERPPQQQQQQQQRVGHQHLQQHAEHWQSQQQQQLMQSVTTGSSSSSRVHRPPPSRAAAAAAGGAYSIVPTATAPTVAAAAARSAARSAARAAAAIATTTAGGSSSSVSLPPAEQCVPQQFWGLMREELRPWHKQVLVQLCYCLPPPACFIYRDMRAGTMQGVLAQRAMLEKAVRQCLLDLMWQQKRLRGWLDVVTRKDAGYVNPDNLRQAEKELLQLKATIGRSKKQLQQLQLKARTYSDSDYCQYSSQFEPLLQQLDELCDTARQDQIGLISDIQSLADAASRRALYARSAAAAAAVQQQAAAAIQQKVDQQLVIWKLVKQQVRGLSSKMRGQQGLERQGGQGSTAADDSIAWRYPPAQYVLWRLKGRVGSSRPPLALPGLSRKMPQVRQNVEQV